MGKVMKHPVHPGKIIKHTINATGLVVTESAERLGVSRSTLSRVIKVRGEVLQCHIIGKSPK